MGDRNAPRGRVDLIARARHPAHRPGRERRERAAAGAVFVVSGFHAGTWSSRIPAIRAGLDISPAQLGLALLGSGLGLLVGIAAATPLSGRLAERRWAAGTSASYAATIALLGVAPTFPVLLGALILVGLAGGVVTVTENMVGAALERAQGRPAMSMLFGLMSAGVLAGGATGALAASLGVPPAGHFGSVAVGLATVSLLAGRWLVCPSPSSTRVRSRSRAARPAGRTWLLVLIAFVAVFTYGTTMDWSALYVSTDLGAGQAVAAVAPTVFVGLLCAGRLVGNLAVRRFGGPAALRAGAVVASLGAGMLGTAPDPTTALTGLAILGSGLSCVLPLVTAAAAATRPGAGATVGLVSAAANSAYLVGPPVVGLAAARAGLATVFLALTVPIVVLVAVAGRALRDVPVD